MTSKPPNGNTFRSGAWRCSWKKAYIAEPSRWFLTPQKAYFVKCDSETTTQSDIDHGIVNILVGFAPLKPAEFVIVKIQQIAGQLGT